MKDKILTVIWTSGKNTESNLLKETFIQPTRNKLFPFLQYKNVKEKHPKAFVMFLQANRLFHNFDSRVLYQW